MELKSQDKIVTVGNILSIFKKNWVLILLVTIIVGAAGSSYGLFLTTPKYTATTQLIAKITNDNGATLAGQVQATNQMSTTLSQVLVSPTIIVDAKKQLNLNKSIEEIKKNISVTASSTSQVVTLTVTNTNAYAASDLANKLASVFIKKAPDLMNVSNISILAPAQPNTTPTSPNKKLIIAASIVFGIIAGMVISMAKALLNIRIQTQYDLEVMNINYLGGVSKIQ